MYTKTRIKLTLLYSTVFPVLFIGFSASIYLWMNSYFGDNGSERPLGFYYRDSVNQPEHHVETSSDVIMDRLKTILIVVDIVMLFGIPIFAWILTGKSLEPIRLAHKRERDFFTNASHDLRTPLSILKGEIDLALRKYNLDKDSKAVLLSNKEEVENLISLTTDMLSFSQIGNNSRSEEFENLDLTDTVLESIHSLKHKADLKNIAIKYSLPKESIFVYGNKLLIKRLFSNILDNAIKYTYDKGEVLINFVNEKRDINVIISDNGKGISEIEQKRVFDRFYRSEPNSKEKGYGLGLSIVKEIVEYHKGSIKINSSVGKGTTVTVSLPQIKPDLQSNLS